MHMQTFLKDFKATYHSLKNKIAVTTFLLLLVLFLSSVSLC